MRVAKKFGYDATYNPNPPVLSAGLLTGTSANYLFAIVLDATGSNIYYTGRNTATVWKMPVATLTSAAWAGNGGLTYGNAGRDGGLGTGQLYAPVQLTFDTIGNMYVADSYDGRIRKIDYSNQYMSSMAGNPSSLVCCNGDGTGTGAGMCYPGGVTVDGSNNVYFYDYHRIRTVTQAGVVSTIAGDSTVSSSGFVNATGASAKFAFGSGGPPPSKLTCDKVNGFLYVNDVGNSVIRKIVISTGVVTTYISAQASSLYCDAVGNLFICLSSGIWVYTPTGVSTLLAPGSYYNDNVDMTISSDNTTIYLAYAAATQIKRIVLGSIMV
jgi:hypothetical protein